MAKYRKKPAIIDAWQWQGHSVKDAQDFCLSNKLPFFNTGVRKGKAGLIIPTKKGDMVAEPNDWIIKGVEGEFYPCKPDIFERIYELVK